MDLFEGMIQKDQDEFRKIMNRLMSTGFILRRKQQTKSDYYFILRHRSVFERYLDVLSYQIDINEEYGVNTGDLILSKVGKDAETWNMYISNDSSKKLIITTFGDSNETVILAKLNK